MSTSHADTLAWLGQLERGEASLPAQGESRDLTAGMGAFLPMPVLSGVAVTPESALTFTAVYSGINIISTDVGSSPLELRQAVAGGGQVHLVADPRYDLCYCEPNRDTTAIRYKTAQMGHVLGWGNSYSEIERLKNGLPAAFHLLSPRRSDTRPVRTRDKRLFYETDGGRGPTLPAEDVLHIAGLGFDGLVGYSPIGFARQAVGLGIAAEQFGAALFGNGSIPRGVLEVEGELTSEAQARLRENFERIHQGTANAHRIAVLEANTKWKPTQINPDDAQFLETRRFQILEIARIFNIPPHKLGDYSAAGVRANVEESNREYIDMTLRCWLIAIEQEYNRKLLTREERHRGLSFAHNMASLLRGNTAARTVRNQAMSRAGALSPDDWRLDEGMPPIGPEKGGDLYLVQKQMIPTEDAAKSSQLELEAAEPKPNQKTEGEAA